MSNPIYFNGAGKAFIAPSDNSRVVRDLGNIASMVFAPDIGMTEHQESSSGENTTDFMMIDSRTGTVTLGLEGFNPKNLALWFLGKDSVKEAGVVTVEVQPPGLAVGDRVLLLNQRVSNLVLTDSTSSPVTLDLGTHYTATPDELEYGAYNIKSLTGLTQPLKAAYSYGESIPVTFLSQDLTPQYLRLEGMNRANSKAKLLVEWWRIQFTVIKNMEFITEKGIWKAELTGKPLSDPGKGSDPELGRYGRIQLLQDA